MPRPELWIIAGPNGAGKTTFVEIARSEAGLPEHAFINPDAITLSYLREMGIESWKDAPADLLKTTFIRAANDAERLLQERVESGGIALIETVLSTRKYCALVESVRELGGVFNLIYVALSSAELSGERVAIRKSRGGHDVPADKLLPRWRASLENLPWFAVRSDNLFFYDNSSSSRDEPHVLLVSGAEQVLTLHGLPSPAMRGIIAEFIRGFVAQDTGRRWRLDIDEPFIPATDER
ncbi:MAG: zeta toxin family protein [Prosthecobacter sp.]|nr:zeta toxin family protein [Prosthecobacter sp.]